MADQSSPDYKALFLRAEEERKRSEEERKRLEEERDQERKRAEEERKTLEEERDQEREKTRKTTFEELIRHCHNLFSRQLRVEHPSRSTTGTIPPPKGKYCPLQLLPWVDCAARQQDVYHAVCNYLEPLGEDGKRLFSSRTMLEGLGEEFSKRPISSEQDLAGYERFGVENHVRDIITELCKQSAARDRFHLGDGVRFDNHAQALDPAATASSTDNPSKPDQYCIRRIDGGSNTLLTTVEYKPPHKLPVEMLRSGLRPMRFCEEVVWPNSTPTQEPEKLRYKAARVTGSAIVQEFHVMIEEGLEYSYLTNGLALVLLRVPYNDPTTLYYHLCEPNMEVNPEDDQSFQQPLTTIARALCLCLMSFGSTLRDQKWRDRATDDLPVWETSFDNERSQVQPAELQQIVQNSPYAPSESTSSGRTLSEWLPSSPVGSPTDGRRPPTRSQTQSQSRCAPSDPVLRDESSEADEEAVQRGQKRRFSPVTSSPSSPSAQRLARGTGPGYSSSVQNQHHSMQFCTQRCLFGLRKCGSLDERCPNVTLHRRGGSSSQHLINSEILVLIIKQQLDDDIDDCTPMGGCGASGAPFKITCSTYGYTLVGKGTTSWLWNEVSREADIYHILSRVQGSAVPVFLGTIDLAKTYFLHGAGPIRHMLLMAWAGKPIDSIKDFRREIKRSVKDIRSLGVIHEDLREDNLLWNAELGRVLIIDFHRSGLDPQLMKKRVRPHAPVSCEAETSKPKRSRVV